MFMLVHAGFEQLQADIKLMLGKRIGWYWKISWKFVSPLALVVSAESSICFNKMLWSGHWHFICHSLSFPYSYYVHLRGNAYSIANVDLSISTTTPRSLYAYKLPDHTLSGQYLKKSLACGHQSLWILSNDQQMAPIDSGDIRSWSQWRTQTCCLIKN